jgi:hypothetical protein
MSGVDGRPRQVLIRNRAIRRGRCALAPPSLKSSWPSLGVRTFEAAPMYYVISRTDTKVSSTPVRRLAHLGGRNWHQELRRDEGRNLQPFGCAYRVDIGAMASSIHMAELVSALSPLQIRLVLY